MLYAKSTGGFYDRAGAAGATRYAEIQAQYPWPEAAS